jgi:membrane dipeptidase
MHSELRAMAHKRGVVGIYLMPFLDVEGSRDTDLVIRHLEHAIQVCGEDHVGIGSDLSVTPIEETPEYRSAARSFVETRKATGNAAPGEDLPLYIPDLNHPRRLESIAFVLSRRGHSSSRIEKIIGTNFARVFKETGHRRPPSNSRRIRTRRESDASSSANQLWEAEGNRRSTFLD